MCNFSPVRNLLIALAAAVGWAVSSAWFAYFWGGVPVVSTISWGITGAAAVLVLVLTLLAISAVNTFCTCVAAVSACSTACTTINTALLLTLLPIFALGYVSANHADRNVALLIVFYVTSAFAVLTGWIASLAATLSTCQNPPRPPTPPPGSGSGPLTGTTPEG